MFLGVSVYAWLLLVTLSLPLLFRLRHPTDPFKENRSAMFLVLVTLVFDGILENLPIVLFDYQYTLGVRFWNIPLENFLFGFDLLAFSLVVYEYWYDKIPQFFGRHL